MKSFSFPSNTNVLLALLLLGTPQMAQLPTQAQARPISANQLTLTTTPMRMVILPFKNITRLPEDAWMAESFSESLTMSLTQVNRLQVIERSQIQAVLQEQSFTQSAFVDPQTAPELGKILGATKVLIGNYQKIGPTLVVNTRVVDVVSGQIDPGLTTQVQGPAQDVLALQSQLSRRFLSSLNISPNLNLSTLTGNSEAYNLYRQALDQARRGSSAELAASQRLLEAALKADPRFFVAQASYADILARRAQETESPTERQALLDLSLLMAQKALSSGATPAQVYPALANVYIARGERNKGLETLRETLKSHPEDIDSLLAYLRFSDSDPVKQQSELEDLGVDMNNPWVQFALGSRYLKQAQMALEPQTASALNLLRKAQTQLPDYSLIPLRIGEVYVLNQDYAKANEAFKSAISLDPNNFLLYFLAARAQLSGPEQAQVQSWLERSIALNPQFGYSQMTLGYFHSRNGRTDLALDYFKQAEAIFPDNAALAFVRAKSHFTRRQYEQARPYLLMALQKIGSDATEQIPKGALYFKLGEVEADLGNTAEAIRYYTLATGEDRAHKAWSYLKLSRIYLAEDQQQESRQAFERYLLSSGYPPLANPDQYNLALLSELGRYALMDGDYPGASRYFSQALDLANDNPVLRYNLALSLFYQRQWSNAIAAFQALLAKHPEHEKAQFNLGLAYLRNNQPQQARQIWQNLLSRSPGNAQAREALAQFQS
jgi:tetratricopeptide (TPR) repeat protein